MNSSSRIPTDLDRGLGLIRYIASEGPEARRLTIAEANAIIEHIEDLAAEIAHLRQAEADGARAASGGANGGAG